MKYEEIMACIQDINGPWSNAACMGYCLIAMRRADHKSNDFTLEIVGFFCL